jgi:hypothetical protein
MLRPLALYSPAESSVGRHPVRNALILLGVVDLVIVVGGAVNHAVAFDIDYVFGSWAAVSMFWIAVGVAATMTVVGLLTAWLARSAAVDGQRKLEGELERTYERLRAAETASPRPADREGPSAHDAPIGVVPAAASEVPQGVRGDPGSGSPAEGRGDEGPSPTP